MATSPELWTCYQGIWFQILLPALTVTVVSTPNLSISLNFPICTMGKRTPSASKGANETVGRRHRGSPSTHTDTYMRFRAGKDLRHPFKREKKGAREKKALAQGYTARGKIRISSQVLRLLLQC